jgi:hypothetical protein
MCWDSSRVACSLRRLEAGVRDCWIVAVATWWNIAPNGDDALTGG